MYEYCNAKLCHTDQNSFIVHVKSKDVCRNLGGEIDQRFDTLNYKFKRPKDKEVFVSLHKGKNKK